MSDVTYKFDDLKSQVKLVLRTAAKKIGIGNTASYPISSGTTVLVGVVLADGYKGNGSYLATTTVTSTDVYLKLEKESPEYMNLGSIKIGTTSALTTDYVSADSLITIPKVNFKSVPANDESFKFTTNTDLSETDCDTYLTSYENYLTDKLKSKLSLTLPVNSDTDQQGVVVNGVIVEIIKYAVAYRIYTETFAAATKEIGTSIVDGWKKFEVEEIQNILDGETLIPTTGGTPPVSKGLTRYTTSRDLFHKKGIRGVHEGEVNV